MIRKIQKTFLLKFQKRVNIKKGSLEFCFSQIGNHKGLAFEISNKKNA